MGNRSVAIQNAARVSKKAGSNFVRWVYAKTGARFWIWMVGSVVAWLVLYAVVPKSPQDSSVSYVPTLPVQIFVGATEVPTARRVPTVKSSTTARPKPIATFTVPPTNVPPPISTATLVPSSSAPLPTEKPQSAQMASCTGNVAQQFLAVWPSLKTTLGCPGQLINTTQFAYQNFQHGQLIWRGMELDENIVTPATDETFLVLFADNSWQLLQNAKFLQGDPTYACSDLGSPNSYLTPKRGFGKLLCNRPDIRQKLGNPISSEIGYPTAFVQEFDNGFLIHYHRSNGSWQTTAFFYGQNAKSGTWK